MESADEYATYDSNLPRLTMSETMSRGYITRALQTALSAWESYFVRKGTMDVLLKRLTFLYGTVPL